MGTKNSRFSGLSRTSLSINFGSAGYQGPGVLIGRSKFSEIAWPLNLGIDGRESAVIVWAKKRERGNQAARADAYY